MLTMMGAFENLVKELDRVIMDDGTSLTGHDPRYVLVDKEDPGLQKALEDAEKVFEKHSGANASRFLKEILARNRGSHG